MPNIEVNLPPSVFSVADCCENELSVSAIIPAYNEARGIEAVLRVIQQIDCLAEIIIVDDGSEDDTLEIVGQLALLNPKLSIIRHESNLGKGQAIFTGWRAAHSACLLFIDAD